MREDTLTGPRGEGRGLKGGTGLVRYLIIAIAVPRKRTLAENKKSK